METDDNRLTCDDVASCAMVVFSPVFAIVAANWTTDWKSYGLWR